MMTRQDLTAALKAAGLKGHLIGETNSWEEGCEVVRLFVDFRDLPAEGANPALDAVLKANLHNVADKGLILASLG